MHTVQEQELLHQKHFLIASVVIVAFWVLLTSTFAGYKCAKCNQHASSFPYPPAAKHPTTWHIILFQCQAMCCILFSYCHVCLTSSKHEAGEDHRFRTRKAPQLWRGAILREWRQGWSSASMLVITLLSIWGNMEPNYLLDISLSKHKTRLSAEGNIVILALLSGQMPIKWLALECIQHRIFTHKSDIWSFGTFCFWRLGFGWRSLPVW